MDYVGHRLVYLPSRKNKAEAVSVPDIPLASSVLSFSSKLWANIDIFCSFEDRANAAEFRFSSGLY